MNNKINNILTMIGCNRQEFLEITSQAIGEISFSSGSWYSPFYLYDNNGLLAKYESNGNLIFKR